MGFLFGFANVEFIVWMSYQDVLMRIARYGFPSGLRTVGFRVCISYLDFRFDYPNAVTRLTVDRADAYCTPTCVFPINNSDGFLVELPNIDLLQIACIFTLAVFYACMLSRSCPRKLTHEGHLWCVFSLSLDCNFGGGACEGSLTTVVPLPVHFYIQRRMPV